MVLVFAHLVVIDHTAAIFLGVDRKLYFVADIERFILYIAARKLKSQFIDRS